MRRHLTTAAIMAAIGFAVLLVLSRTGADLPADAAAARSLDRLDPTFAGRLARVGSVLGDLRVTLPVTLALALAFVLRGPRRAWPLPFLIVITAFVELGAKGALGMSLLTDPVGFLRDSLQSDASAPLSFPSGHVARITFLAVLAMRLLPNTPTRALLIVPVAVTSFARAYQGGHNATDVLGGVVLGAAIALAALAWLQKSTPRSTLSH